MTCEHWAECQLHVAYRTVMPVEAFISSGHWPSYRQHLGKTNLLQSKIYLQPFQHQEPVRQGLNEQDLNSFGEGTTARIYSVQWCYQVYQTWFHFIGWSCLKIQCFSIYPWYCNLLLFKKNTANRINLHFEPGFVAMAGFVSVEKFLDLVFAYALIVFEKKICWYIVYYAEHYSKIKMSSRECLFMQNFSSTMENEYGFTIVNVHMHDDSRTAETSEHNIYANAGLSSPFTLSPVMILSFQFLLSLYHCTSSTYPSQ